MSSTAVQRFCHVNFTCVRAVCAILYHMNEKTTILPDPEEEARRAEPGGVFGTLERLRQITDHPAADLTIGRDVLGPEILGEVVLTPAELTVPHPDDVPIEPAAEDISGTIHARKGVHGHRAQLLAELNRAKFPKEFEGTELANDHSHANRVREDAEKADKLEKNR